MTTTDVLLSTDGGGVEHWERHFEPTLATDIMGLLWSNVGIGPAFFEIGYADGTGYGRDSNAGQIILSDRIRDTNPSAPFDERENVTMLLYYDALDIDLPAGAHETGWRFDLPYIAVSLINPVGAITAALDLWDLDRPISPSDMSAIDDARSDPLGIELGATQLTLLDGAAPEPTVWSQPLTSAAQTAVLGKTSVFGVRFSIRPWPMLATDGGPQSFAGLVPLSAFVSWAASPFSARFVLSYTTQGEASTVRPQVPRYHTAKQLLDAQRQPGVLIGRRPLERIR